MNWAIKLSITQPSITGRSTGRSSTERVVTVAERVRCSFADQRRRCAVVVDRDPEVVSTLSALLAPQLDVHSAFCPLSAALLLDRLEHVDLAFLELELPDFAGEQLLQQLGRWPDAIRVLLAQHPPNAAARSRDSRGGDPRSRDPRGQSAPASVLPRNAYLAHLVLSKPISAQVVRALQRATLGLLRV
jgi:CheY-like chemotaxis protein